MNRDEVQKALEAARDFSHHHEFVIAGSLSVLGRMDTPPELMSMSIDIDFFPLHDPGRANEIAAVLGEDSAFHERNGYYLDPISPELPVLPAGWRERLVEIKLGKITAYFLDVNDTAVSKYARSAPNDFRWLEAGYEANILNIDIIESRVRFNTSFFDADDRRKTNNGLLMHRVAMRSNGSLDKDLLAYLDANPPECVRALDTDAGVYIGIIAWTNQRLAVQSFGEGEIAIHKIHDWPNKPKAKDMVTITYHAGGPSLKIKPPDLDWGPLMGR